MLQVDQPLLGGAPDDRAVRPLLSGGLVEAVRVGAEVQQRERAVPGGRGAQLGERDGVVAAQTQRHGARVVHGARNSCMEARLRSLKPATMWASPASTTGRRSKTDTRCAGL